MDATLSTISLPSLLRANILIPSCQRNFCKLFIAMSKRKRTCSSSVGSVEEGVLPKSARECFFKLLETEEFCDAEFEVGPTRERIRSHKLFLMARSPVIRTNFNGCWKQKKVVQLPQFQPSAFRAFLKYIYTDDIGFDQLAWLHLLEIAHYFMATDLVRICIDNVGKWDISILIDGYRMARHYGMGDLMANLGAAMARSFLELSKLDEFQGIDDETLGTLLERDDLRVNESGLFKIIKTLVDARVESSGESTMTVAGEMEKFLSYIRIPVMTLEEFHQTVVKAGILPNETAFNVYRYFVSTLPAEKKEILVELPYNATPRRCCETVELYSPLLILSHVTSSIPKNALFQDQIELFCKSESDDFRSNKAIQMQGCGDHGMALTAVILNIPHLFQDTVELIERVTGTLKIATNSSRSPSVFSTLYSEAINDEKFLTGGSYLAKVNPPLPLNPDGIFFQISASVALEPSEFKTGSKYSITQNAEALKEMSVAKFCKKKINFHSFKSAWTPGGGDDYQLIRKLIIKAM